MGEIPARDIAAEAAKHFHGTPAERLGEALRLGRESLRRFLATQPAGTTEEAARQITRHRKHAGRRPSRVLDGAGS